MANAFVAGGIWPQNDLISKAIDSEKNKRVLKLNLSNCSWTPQVQKFHIC